MGPCGGLTEDSSCKYLKDRQQNNGDNEPAENPSSPFGNIFNLINDCPDRFHKLPPYPETLRRHQMPSESFAWVDYFGVMGFSLYGVPSFQKSCFSILFRTALSVAITESYTLC